MPAKRTAAGFTLIELIMVMVITGIMAFVAIPRFADRTFDEKAFHDGVIAAVQHGRRMAVAGRRFSCVNVTIGAGAAGIVEIRRDTTSPESVTTVACAGGAGTPLALPAPGRNCAATNQVCAPGNVSILSGSSSLIFDPLGRLVDSSKAVVASALEIRISNQKEITVQPESGYVQ